MIAVTKKELHSLWEERIRSYRASGQSLSEWCTENQVKPPRLRHWLRKFEYSEDAHPTSWLTLSTEEGKQRSITVRVGRAEIDVPPGFDRQLLAEIIGILSHP